MAKRKFHTAQEVSKRKKSRKAQLAEARQCRKVERTQGCATDAPTVVVSGRSTEVVPEPSTSYDPIPASSHECFLEEKTRSEFKVASCETLIEGKDTSEPQSTERAIIDVIEMDSLIKTLCCPQCKTDSLELYINPKKTKGLAVFAEVQCSHCEETISQQFLAAKRGRSFCINDQVVYASLMCGFGAASLNKFCESLNLSGLHHKTFHQKASSMFSKQASLEQEVFSQTVKFVRKVHADIKDVSLGVDDVLDIAVSYDGTWLTRGHTSHVGVGCVVDLLTGLCLDAQ